MSEPSAERSSEGSSPKRLNGWWVVAAWAVTWLLWYIGMGSFLDESFDGIVFEQRSLDGLALAGAAMLGSVALTAIWARGLRGPDGAGAAPTRRRFLAGSAGIVGGFVTGVFAGLIKPRGWALVVSPAITAETPKQAPEPKRDWRMARVQSYRALGSTGFEVSDISLGSGRIRGEQGERVAREAIERGINYFDTAPDYSETGSERALGKAMQGRRDQMFLATKFCTPTGHLQAGAPVRQYVEVVEASLKRLQTDYVDLIHIHACDTVERLLDPNVHEAFDRLKEQGKARFLGFSSHTPRLEKITETAIEDGRIDVMMLAYHHGAWPGLAGLIERASAQGIGVVAMKTLKGAKHRGLMEFRPEADSYTQAAFKWVLNDPSVDCLVISFSEPQHLDEYLYASGKKLTEADLAVLRRYDELIAGTHCVQHCGACLDSCPENLAIDDVLRQRMYFEDYGDEKEAMRLYAALPKKADVCASCSAPCTGTCPYGIAIQERMTGAHELLTLG